MYSIWNIRERKGKGIYLCAHDEMPGIEISPIFSSAYTQDVRFTYKKKTKKKKKKKKEKKKRKEKKKKEKKEKKKEKKKKKLRRAKLPRINSITTACL